MCIRGNVVVRTTGKKFIRKRRFNISRTGMLTATVMSTKYWPRKTPYKSTAMSLFPDAYSNFGFHTDKAGPLGHVEGDARVEIGGTVDHIGYRKGVANAEGCLASEMRILEVMVGSRALAKKVKAKYGKFGVKVFVREFVPATIRNVEV